MSAGRGLDLYASSFLHCLILILILILVGFPLLQAVQ
jgi:hypothetical protein